MNLFRSLSMASSLLAGLLLSTSAVNAQVVVGIGTGPIPDGTASAPGNYGKPRDILFPLFTRELVESIEVEFSVSHTFVGDLRVQLIAPDGRSHILFERTGATDDVSPGFGSNLVQSNTLRFSDAVGSDDWWTAADIGDADILAGNYFSAAPGGAGVSNPAPQTSFGEEFRTAIVNSDEARWILRFEDGYSGDTGTVHFAQLTINTIGQLREVTTFDDSGPGSLREALSNANPGDFIFFNSNMVGTVFLDSRLPVIPDGVQISAVSSRFVRIERNSPEQFRIFHLPASSSATIRGLTIANGNEPGGFGGGIYSQGNLHLIEVALESNQSAFGGGLFSSELARLTMIRCLVMNNQTEFSGAGVYNLVNGNSRIDNTTFALNQAATFGGGLMSASFGVDGAVNLRNNTFLDNSAQTGPGLYVQSSVPMPVTLSSTLFEGPSPLVVAAGNASIDSQGYNLSADGANGLLDQPTDQLDAHAGVAMVDDNGGFMLSAALLPDSDAIDAGRVFGVQRFDGRGRGNHRISGIPNPAVEGSDGSDIGAFERISDDIFSGDFED